MTFRPRRMKSKLVNGLPKIKMDRELIRVDLAALNEIKSASPGIFTLKEMAIGTTQPLRTIFKEEFPNWSVFDDLLGSLLSCRLQATLLDGHMIGLKGGGLQFQ